MRLTTKLWLFPLSVVLMSAADDPPTDQAWKDKQVAEWSDADAKQILNDSPWAKSTTPSFVANQDESPRPAGGGMGRGGGGGMGRRGGIGIGGIGVGIPGMGGAGRRQGGGGQGGGRDDDGYPNGGRQQRRDDEDGPRGNAAKPAKVIVRWESALPVREAELKARETDAPTLDEDHYAIAVYGVPRRIVSDDSKHLAEQLKKEAAIKRDGQKDLKPSSVEILQRDNGPVIVYLFPRTKEITKKDRRLQFDAQMGRLRLSQSFYLEDMTYRGKTEL